MEKLLIEILDRLMTANTDEFIPTFRSLWTHQLAQFSLKDSSRALQMSNILLDYSKEAINAVPYKNVTRAVRIMYTYSGIAKCLALWLQGTESGEHLREEMLKEIMELLDMIIIMTGVPVLQPQIFEWVDLLLSLFPNYEPRCIVMEALGRVSLPKISFPVAERQMSISAFSLNLAKERPNPVMMRGGIHHWPALRKWNQADYLLHHIGRRLIPVEIGSSYTSSNWTQKLMNGYEFLTEFVFPEAPPVVGYCAQHNLLTQIPALRDDILIPDYCYCTENDDQEVIMNTWLGPKGTVSPLHTDPHHNMFAQVVGTKYVCLYGPEESGNLYPHGGILGNTSQVDLIHPDFKQFPRFANAQFTECLVYPGDLLFIPKGWYHHVQSLSASFSFSFWF